MGWLATTGDLESIMIPVSPGQRDVLEHGGEVLVLQGLPDAGSYYCGCGAFHQAFDGADGSAVMVTAILRSSPAFDVCPVNFPRPAGVQTFEDLIDEYHDEHWRFWPSYTGSLIQTIDVLDWTEAFFQEEPQVTRIWAGIPVDDIGPEIANEIMMACNARVEATPYFFIERMTGYAEGDGIPSQEDLEADDRGEYEDFVHAAEMLHREGLWDPNEHDFTPLIGMDLAYAPMEQYLTPAALQVWHRLHDGAKTSARKARRTIRKGELNLYDWNERGFDPWV